MKELNKTDTYKFILVIENKSYFYTGTVKEETDDWILIKDNIKGEMRLNKKYISTIYILKGGRR